jgi:transcription elongation factor Elf1
MSDRVICPFCGQDITDFYTDKFLDSEGRLVCPECGGIMEVSCEVIVSYTVQPVFS